MQSLSDSLSDADESLVMTCRPSVRPMNRLIGLETEYAVRYRDAASIGEGISHRDVFRGAIQALKTRLPLAPADAVKEGFFAANGSAIWFERSRLASETGLIEGSTPECRGPMQLVTHQRAMDKLIGEAVVEGSPLEDTSLLKNCLAPNGRSYGAQENYEVEFAKGWRLSLWKMFVYMLMPISFFMILFDLFVAWVFIGKQDTPLPPWMDSLITPVLRLFAMPAAIGISSFLPLLPYRKTQRQLTPFLISRIAFAGAGSLNRNGEFLLAEKAASRNRQYFTVLVDFDRPIFSLNNLFKPLFTVGLFPKRSRGIFRKRQRLQIGIGDSNMCEEAEYLKIGTTLLVIDAIEAGYLKRVPHMWTPMSVLQRWNRDTEFTVAVRTSLGNMTMLDVQAYYLSQVKKYLTDCKQVPLEAWKLVERWEDVLGRLKHDRASLFGRLDWVTKQQLIENVKATQPDTDEDGSHNTAREQAILKKVDLKYHELAADGYFRQLDEAGLTQQVVEEADVERARRLPPPINPAAARCNYIREFVGSVEWVSWDTVQLGPKFNNRLVLLEEEPERAPRRRRPRSTYQVDE